MKPISVVPKGKTRVVTNSVPSQEPGFPVAQNRAKFDVGWKISTSFVILQVKHEAMRIRGETTEEKPKQEVPELPEVCIHMCIKRYINYVH